MADTLSELVAHHGERVSDRRAKALADFDLRSLRKLERSPCSCASAQPSG